MSRNSNRVGGPKGPTPPAGASSPNMNREAPVAPPQGGFSFVMPTEMVELPSEGKYYPEDHPLHNVSTIELKQMTTKEEDILTSRSLLKKGVALDRVIQSVIVDKRINAANLLTGDRNAIIIASRVSGYGNLYTTKVNCPSCQSAQTYEFDLNEAQIYGGDADSFDDMNITNNHDGTFDVELPRTKVSATFRLLTGADEKRLMKSLNIGKRSRSQNTKIEKNISGQLKNLLVAVNGDGTEEAINYFIENMPSMDSRHLRMAYKTAAPDVDLTQDFECSACGEEAALEVPLSADFFWPQR